MEPVMVIGVSGPIRGGKGTAVKIIKTILGEDLCVASTGAIIEAKLRAYGIANTQDRSAKQDGFLRIAEAEGDQWIQQEALKIWENSRKPVWLFDAILMEWDEDFVRSFPCWMHIHVTAPLEVRWQRAVQAALRGEPDSKPDEANMTLREFEKLHQHKTAEAVGSFETKPGVTAIRNIGPTAHLGGAIVAALMNRRLITSLELDRKREKLQELYHSIKP